MQSNDAGTISALTSTVSALEATVTALGGTATQMAQVQADNATFQAQQTVSQLNNSATSVSQATPPASQNQTPPANNSGSVSIGTPNGFALDAPVTAKTLDGNGCAINPATTFSTTDTKIWVVAKAHNLKKGEVFTANWAGTITHQDTWTANYSAVVTCIHFYVQPQTLNMGAGDWTVTLSAADAQGASATFTLQGAQPAATQSSQ
jgi:hypothetical protein